MPLILLIIGFILIIYNYVVIKKENKNESASFNNILDNNKSHIDDYKLEIGQLRKDIAESLTELQEEILDIRSRLNYFKESENLTDYNNNEEYYNINLTDLKDESKKIVNDKEQNSEEDISFNSVNDSDVISEINFNNIRDSNSSKTEAIKELLDKNLSDEEICHKLSVSKGEVLLVKGLFKK